MAKFIKVSARISQFNLTTHINVEQICYFVPDATDRNSSTVALTNGNTIKVHETTEVLERLIANAK